MAVFLRELKQAVLGMNSGRSDRSELIARGAWVLATEARALENFSRSLGDSFAAAVELMLNVRGRVVVAGMGKSGHVARKVAATLASTGTPAQFVHPGEASHGDMGMITPDDALLLLSNSGETPELADMIRYTRRFKIPMIGVARNPDSTLIKRSDVGIVLPKAPEVCPNGLAPTTSTTMTLALGDALAVVLMEQRKFSPENYRDLHPGGALGAQLSTVAELMHKGDELPLVAPQTPMSEAILVMSTKGFGALGIIDADGILAGVITDGDLRRNMDGLLDRQAQDVMTADPKTVSPDILASKALGIMDGVITTLFAVDEMGKPLGILHVHDCLRAGVA